MKTAYFHTICDKTGVVTYEIYRRNNKRHRDPTEGPAVIRRNPKTGDVRCVEYWVDGKLHRDPKDGPAVLVTSVKTGVVRQMEYWVNGQLHRNPKDGPAVVARFESGELRTTQYWVNDRLHRDPNEGPASSEVYACKSVVLDRYYVDGNLHRNAEDGPAMIHTHCKNGIAFELRFFENDRVCTRAGPSRVLFDHETGELVAVRFETDETGYVRNHRDGDGPSMMKFAAGKCTEIHYQRFGRLHREGGPAEIYLDPDTDIITDEGYYQDGKLHRALREGPAVIGRDPNDGRVTRQEYYYKGDWEPPPLRPADYIRLGRLPVRIYPD